MSEFTSGVLFRNSHIEMVKMLALNHKVHILNPRWSVILIPEQGNVHEPAISRLKAFSNACPLLNFWHAGDHGWAYQIFTRGQTVASIDVNYELDYVLKLKIAQARYPNEPDIHIFWNQHPEISDALNKEVLESVEYRISVQRMFEDKNTQSLAAFGLNPAVIKEIDALLTTDQYYENVLEQVESFKQLVGTWVSYHYLSLDD